MKGAANKSPHIRRQPAEPRRPLYEEIIAAVRTEIAAGKFGAGDVLPSVRAMANDRAVSAITVKRAYEELQRAGVVHARRGLGTFVAEDGRDIILRTNRDAARARLRFAVAAGRQAGLTDNELLGLLEEEM